MTVHAYVLPHGGNPTIRIDYKCRALGRNPEHLPDAERLDNRPVYVGDHGKGQAELLYELSLALGLVCTHANHGGVDGLKGEFVRLEVLRFMRSTRGVRTRVEVDNHPLPAL